MGAVVVAGALIWLGTGLDPVWWLTWIAPVPVFAWATRGSARLTAVVAFLAAFIGGGNLFTYYRADVGLPAPVVAGFLAVQAAMFMVAVLLFRSLDRRGWTVRAVLVAAAMMAGAEYLVSLVSPGGAFTSLAYTQADIRPVIQVVSVTGVWGVTFLLVAVPAVLAVLLARRAWLRPTLALTGLLVVVLPYGAWRSSQHRPPAVPVGLVAVAQSVDGLAWDSPEAARVLDRYLVEVARLAGQGAAVIVLPEKVFRVTPSEVDALGARLAGAAGTATVVLGLTLRDDDGFHNVAVAFTGATAIRYDKQHLVPGLEDHFTPGTTSVRVPGTGYGLAICKDLDYPGVGRAYAGAGALLVPGLDFDRDGRLHSRIAMTRGVESGLTIVRSATRGRVTASDSTGRVLAESGGTALLVRVPVGVAPTVYTRLGDWFGWLCLVLAAVVPLIRWGRPRRRILADRDRPRRPDRSGGIVDGDDAAGLAAGTGVMRPAAGTGSTRHGEVSSASSVTKP